MERIEIKHDETKLKKSLRLIWIMAGVCFVIFLFAKMTIGGYIGAALVGSMLGATIALGGMAVLVAVKMPEKLRKNIPIAAADKDGIELIEAPYDFGKISWNNIVEIKSFSTKALKFVVPVLKDPDAFMNGLGDKQKKMAKRGVRFGGSFAAFPVTTANMELDEIVQVLNKFKNN